MECPIEQNFYDAFFAGNSIICKISKLIKNPAITKFPRESCVELPERISQDIKGNINLIVEELMTGNIPYYEPLVFKSKNCGLFRVSKFITSNVSDIFDFYTMVESLVANIKMAISYTINIDNYRNTTFISEIIRKDLEEFIDAVDTQRYFKKSKETLLAKNDSQLFVLSKFICGEVLGVGEVKRYEITKDTLKNERLCGGQLACIFKSSMVINVMSDALYLSDESIAEIKRNLVAFLTLTDHNHMVDWRQKRYLFGERIYMEYQAFEYCDDSSGYNIDVIISGAVISGVALIIKCMICDIVSLLDETGSKLSISPTMQDDLHDFIKYINIEYLCSFRSNRAICTRRKVCDILNDSITNLEIPFTCTDDENSINTIPGIDNLKDIHVKPIGKISKLIRTLFSLIKNDGKIQIAPENICDLYPYIVIVYRKMNKQNNISAAIESIFHPTKESCGDQTEAQIFFELLETTVRNIVFVIDFTFNILSNRNTGSNIELFRSSIKGESFQRDLATLITIMCEEFKPFPIDLVYAKFNEYLESNSSAFRFETGAFTKPAILSSLAKIIS